MMEQKHAIAVYPAIVLLNVGELYAISVRCLFFSEEGSVLSPVRRVAAIE
jgi:hypothetical protein